MPINVIRIEKGNAGTTSMTPAIETVRVHSYVQGIRVVSRTVEMHGDGYKTASSVYLTNEIETKITKIYTNIDTVKNEINKNISSSLGQIQKDLISLKQDILNSKTFREQLKHEIREDLKSEIIEEIRSEINSK